MGMMNDKEFAVIREISQNSQPNQRAIAQKIGISLGLVNLILKRFVAKGYLKFKEIPPRRICYMLTPKGLAEKAKKSYEFTTGTIRLLKGITSGIESIILKEYQNGMKELKISGSGELAAIAEMAFRNLDLDKVICSRSQSSSKGSKVECCFLISKDGISKKIDIVYELAKCGIEC